MLMHNLFPRISPFQLVFLNFTIISAGVSLGMCQLVWFGQDLSLYAETCPSFKILGLSDIEEVKYRNTSLSQ